MPAPTEGKALMVKHLKQYFAGNSDSETESKPESPRRTSGMSEDIFNRLLALKQRLDDNDEIRVSEQTMKVLHDRQTRRESLKSKSASPLAANSPVSAPSTPLLVQNNFTAVKLKNRPTSAETSSNGIKLISLTKKDETQEKQVKKIKFPVSKKPEKKDEEKTLEDKPKDGSRLDASFIGGRIFLNSRKKSLESAEKIKSPNPPVKNVSTLSKIRTEFERKQLDEEKISQNETKTSAFVISFGKKKEEFKKRAVSPPSTPPSFIEKLRNQQMRPDTNLEINLIVNGFPKPKLRWFRDSHELKMNEYREKWAGNTVTGILFHEFWKGEALLSVAGENEAGKCQNECIVYVDKPYEAVHQISDIESEAEIDSSDISEMVKELRMEQVDIDNESAYSEDFMPRDLSPIFEVTEDEISQSLRSDAGSRRSSIRSIDSIRSTLTMLTPTQSFIITRTPTIEKLAVSVSSDESGEKTPTPEEISLTMAENNYLKNFSSSKVEVSVKLDQVEQIEHARFSDDDVFSVDSYATIDNELEQIETSYTSTKDLMSLVKENFVSKTAYYATDTTDTETEAAATPCYMINKRVVEVESPISDPNTSPNEDRSRHEDILKTQIKNGHTPIRQRKTAKNEEPSTETESELETYHQIMTQRRQKKMTEVERTKKEKNKYRLTQRFIEDSIKGNLTSIGFNQKDFEKSYPASLATVGNVIFSDSEVFLDTDDDGMDTVSEITIDFNGRTTRNEFEQLPLTDNTGSEYIDF
jgi:hypothetical protein